MSTTTTTTTATAPAKGSLASRLPIRPARVEMPEELLHRRPHADDFSWSKDEEPHAIRRRFILQKYPQIQELFGGEPLTAPLVLLLFSAQMAMAYLMADASWKWIVFLGWAIGGTLNHSLQLAVHELSHNSCFDSPALNKVLGVFANFATGVPSSITFQKYHMDHHQFQGVDGMDTDIPTAVEGRIFRGPLGKLLWVILQPFFYAFRPTLVKPKPVGKWEVFNVTAQLAFDAALIYALGFKAFAYLIIGTLLGLGLHPAAGHFIAEHYELVAGQETYSYYGPWNYLNFNVGYHNEHHDFPRVPWSRLPMVKKIAPEFYDCLPSYTSYVSLFYTYITDSELGPFSRVKRVTREGSAPLRQGKAAADAAAAAENGVTTADSNEQVTPVVLYAGAFFFTTILAFIFYAMITDASASSSATTILSASS